MSKTSISEIKNFAKELIINFSKKKKIIPSKFHYDFLGSKYFEKITKTKEYYVTNSEIEILKKISSQLNKILGNNLTYVEFGSGAIAKIKILLNNNVNYYVPLDISLDFIKKESTKLFKNYPKLKILPTYCDYTKVVKLSKNIPGIKVGFFLGSSIGNFYNNDEINFLKNAKKTLGKKSYLIIGVDLKKDERIFKKAYNDSSKSAANFNLNLITRMNKELGTNLVIKDFEYVSNYNKSKGAVESFIFSKKKQNIFINKKKFIFKKGEYIQTEISNKFTIKSFSNLAKNTGWKVIKHWKDQRKYYSIFLLQS